MDASDSISSFSRAIPIVVVVDVDDVVVSVVAESDNEDRNMSL